MRDPKVFVVRNPLEEKEYFAVISQADEGGKHITTAFQASNTEDVLRAIDCGVSWMLRIFRDSQERNHLETLADGVVGTVRINIAENAAKSWVDFGKLSDNPEASVLEIVIRQTETDPQVFRLEFPVVDGIANTILRLERLRRVVRRGLRCMKFQNKLTFPENVATEDYDDPELRGFSFVTSKITYRDGSYSPALRLWRDLGNSEVDNVEMLGCLSTFRYLWAISFATREFMEAIKTRDPHRVCSSPTSATQEFPLATWVVEKISGNRSLCILRIPIFEESGFRFVESYITITSCDDVFHGISDSGRMKLIEALRVILHAIASPIFWIFDKSDATPENMELYSE